MSVTSFRYKAFISYSHAADGRLAPELQKALQRFAKPWNRPWAIRVFRDQTDLSVNPDLWHSVERALGDSEVFILLASPEAAASKWVRREIAYWREHRSSDTLLVVLTAGELSWDEEKGDFDWERTTSLPRSVEGLFKRQPRHLDLRWAKGEQLSLSHAKFRDAIAEIAAPLHGKDKAALESEEVRQNRKTRRLARSAVVGLTALTLSTTFAAIVAVNRARLAERQRRVAVARQLTVQSMNLPERQVDLGLLLAVEGVRSDRNVDSRGALLTWLDRSPHLATLLYGHEAEVGDLALMSDGNVLVSGGKDGGFMLWDLGTDTRVGEPFSAAAGAWHDAIALSDDGRVFASKPGGQSIGVGEVAAGSISGWLFNAPFREVRSLALSPHGRVLAAGGYQSVALWDAERREMLGQPLTGPTGWCFALAFSPDAEILACGGNDGVWLWEIETGELSGPPLRDHTESVHAVTFSPDGRKLAAGSREGVVNLWDVESGQQIGRALTGHSDAVLSVAFDPSGEILASGGLDGAILLWDLRRDTQIGGPLVGGGESISALLFGPKGRTLISGGCRLRGRSNRCVEGQIGLWDLDRGIIWQRLGKQGDRIYQVAFSPDGLRLASGSSDEFEVILWNVLDGAPVGEPLEFLGPVTFSPDGNILATIGRDGAPILWDVANRRPLGQPLVGGQYISTRLAFSPDGRVLASAGWDGTIILWDVDTQSPEGEPLRGHTGTVTALAFHPSERLLASGGNDSTVIMWDLEKRERVGEPLTGHEEPVSALSFAPGGELLASGSFDHTIILWDVETQQPVAQPLIGHSGPVRTVAFSPTGGTLISGGDGIVLWDMATLRQIGPRLLAHQPYVSSVAVSPDGRTLASGGADQTIILWDLDSGTWVRRACRIANRNLTLVEWERYMGDVPCRRTCPDLQDQCGPAVLPVP